ncbi:MAG: DUF977 family protein [Methyloprofundus sp.]|nr:DUF977 family protein [Methyloprofundus sp.]
MQEPKITISRDQAANDIELPLLSVKIIELLKQYERLTIAQIVELSEANQNTLKVHLRELVNAEHIHRHGKARATWYSLR